MMNKRCKKCKGSGMVQMKNEMKRGNGQPYTLVCPDCQGVGHFRDFDAEAVAFDCVS